MSAQDIGLTPIERIRCVSMRSRFHFAHKAHRMRIEHRTYFMLNAYSQHHHSFIARLQIQTGHIYLMSIMAEKIGETVAQ